MANKLWQKGLSKEEQDVLKAAVSESRPVLRQLIKICDQYIDKAIDEMTKDNYFNGDWDLAQANLVAQIKVNKKVKELINSLLTSKD